MIKQKLLLLMLLTSSFYRAVAQPNGVSLNTSDLPSTSVQGSYSGSNYNVDLFSGIANVSVPIHQYSIDGLNLGVTLNYNTKGIKVDDIATSVGLGWNLNAGGFIERNVQGLEDDMDYSVGTELSEGKWVRSTTAQYTGDGQSDIFTVSMVGRSFEFSAVVAHLTKFTNPKSELNIDLSDVQNKIIIIDERGNKFEFTKGDVEWKSENGTTYYAVKKWVIKKITTYSGKEIEYFYTSYNTIYDHYKRAKVTEESDNVNSSWNVSGVEEEVVQWAGEVAHINKIVYPDGTEVEFILDAANYYGRCDITETPRLDKIIIKQELNTNLSNSLTYKFHHNYFNTPVNSYRYLNPINTNNPLATDVIIPHSTTQDYCLGLQNSLTADGLTVDEAKKHLKQGLRLSLDKIEIVGTDGTTSSTYRKFEYSTTHLPLRLSPERDWYGYYNNRTAAPLTTSQGTFALAVPYHSYYDNNTLKFYGTIRMPDLTYMKSFILKKVINETGGEIELFYKAHSLNNRPNSTIPTNMEAINAYDGLCIDKIVYFDGFNTDHNTTSKFTFTNGYRFYNGGFFWYHKLYSDDPQTASSVSLLERIYEAHFVNSLDYYKNCNHGYTNATVEKIGFNQEVISKDEYTFSNIENGDLVDDKSILYQYTFPRNLFKKNELGNVEEIKRYGLHNVLTTTETFEYETISHIPNLADKAYAYYLYQDATSPSGFSKGHYEKDYAHDFSLKRLKKKTTVSHSGATSMTDIKEYGYLTNDNLHTVTWTNSKNETIWEKYFYNEHLQVTGNVYYNMTQAGLQHLISSTRFKGPTTANILAHNQTDLTYSNGKVRTSSLTTATLNEVTSASGFILANNSAKTEITLYDDHDNAIEILKSVDGEYTSFIYDTRIERPLATVANAKYADIAYTSFEALAVAPTSNYDNGNWTFNHSSVVLASNSAMTNAMTGKYCYQLDINNPASKISRTLPANNTYLLTFWADAEPIVKVDGITITLEEINNAYSWKLYSAYITVGSNSQLLTIEDPSTLVNVGFIDELRIHPEEASMVTYTYEPLLGISSYCNSRNNIVYLEYDEFGRQTISKDINGKILSKLEITNQGIDN